MSRIASSFARRAASALALASLLAACSSTSEDSSSSAPSCEPGATPDGSPCFAGDASDSGAGGSAGQAGAEDGGDGDGPVGCAALGFSPCGGDLTGSWALTEGCVDLNPSEVDPTGGSCPSATATAMVQFSGWFKFGADGTYSQNVSNTTTWQYHLPKSCVPAGMNCFAYSTDAIDEGTWCLIKAKKAATGSEMGTVRVEGTDYYTTATGQTSEDGPFAYCMTGNSLEVTWHDQYGHRMGFRATRY